MEKSTNPVKIFYYSEKEWDRLGCGALPPERDLSRMITENQSNTPNTPNADK